MEEKESSHERMVFEKLRSAFVGTNLSIEYAGDRQIRFEDKYIFSPDLIIFRDGRMAAYVDVKSKVSSSSRLSFRTLSLRSKKQAQFDYRGVLFVITDGESFAIEGDKGKEVMMSFEIFISYLRTNESLRYSKRDSDIFEHLFWEQIQYLSNTHKDLIDWWYSIPHGNVFEDNGMSVRFESEELENEFFIHLLGTVNNRELCRYTKLDSLFELLKNQRQNMLTLVCMNDKGELSYVDETVSLPYMPIPDDPNNCFILSLLPTDHRDELTFWRLYGDDASGTCLSYEVDQNVNTTLFPGFYLARVSYGQGGHHPELELINTLIHNTYSGKVFTFWNWHIWKHFFKSEHFAIEDEIRLLFIAKKDQKPDFVWIKNDSNKIVSRMALFGLKPRKNAKIKFPLRLSSILIGPKITESDVIDQYDYMRKANLRSVKSVGPSTIVNIYR